ncbi:MAG: homoserine kinase [Clostridia bacterium]
MRIKVPATSANLGSGYDCLAIALDLWIEVEVDFNYKGILVETFGEGEGYLPTDSRNYFIRMINLYLKRWNKAPVSNIYLKANNNIPLARGLGSSAAVTVASLKIASEIAQIRVSSEESIDLIASLEGHADNGSAAYYGGLVLTGFRERGKMQAVSIPLPEELPLALVAIPDYRVRTKDARKVLPRKVSMYDFVYNNSRTALAVHAWSSGNFELLKTSMEDRVHQYYRMKLVPGGVQMLKAASYCKNVYGASLSGSGSTIIAFGKKEGLLNLAIDWQDIWKRSAIDGNLSILRVSREGVQVSS